MIYMMCGVPGSGKSTYVSVIAETIESNSGKVYVLSSDSVREFFLKDVSDQRFNKEVFSTIKYWLNSLLNRCALTPSGLVDKVSNCPVSIFLDATFIKKAHRKSMIDIVKKHNMDKALCCTYFDIPLEVCKQRNTYRARSVPDYVITRMNKEFETPSLEEGFELIHTISLSCEQFSFREKGGDGGID